MGRLLAILLGVVVIASCGSSSATTSACAGFPTATHSERFLVLFGTISKLTKRYVCSHFGAPTSIRRIAHGREAWRYGSEMLTLRGDQVLAVRANKAPVGG